MSREPVVYDASHLQIFEGLEAVRKRPGMYIGSTGERGLHHMVFEAAERAMDEILAGRASRVDITVLADGGVRVVSDGPGVPFGGEAQAAEPGLETRLTRLMVGHSPAGRTSVVGLGGLGLAVVNALSSRLVADVRHDGRRQVQEYARGVALSPPSDVGPAGDSGTSITFWPDPVIFETTECSFDTLAKRLRELAYLNRELDITLTDERHPSDPRSIRFHAPSGVREMVAFLSNDAAGPGDPDIISFEQDDPQMAGVAEIALRWRGAEPEQLHSFANSRPTTSGGAHVSGFRDGVAAALTTYAREQRRLAATEPDIGADQIGVGLIAVVSVKLDDPEFEGCTHGALGSPAAHAGVRQAVQDHLGAWLKTHPRQASALLNRLIDRTP